jgi:hypothetical protein
MMDAIVPLFLNARLSAQSVAHPDDVTVVKRSLQRLGYYEPWDGELNSLTDSALFRGIQALQRDHGLTADGYMDPDGETASEIGRLLFSKNSTSAGNQTQQIAAKPILVGAGPQRRPSEEECDQIYERDTAHCNEISKMDGPIAGTLCHASATARYAACLHGTPTFDLPPLYRPPREE